MENWRNIQTLDWTIILLSATFLTTLFWSWDVSDASYDLLGLLGLYLIISHRVETRLNREEAILFVCVGFFIIVALLSLWINGMPGNGLRYLRRIVDEFFWLAPIFFMYRARQFPEAIIWVAVAIATTAAGFSAIHDVFLTGAPDTYRRASGGTHPNIFGGISLGLTCITVIGVSFFWRKSALGVIFLLFGTLMGMIAVLLSGSRGSWVAALIVMLVVLVIYWNRLRSYVKSLALLMVAIIPIIGYQIPIVQTRMNQAIAETVTYFQGIRGLASTDTPVGGRFEIWKAGWQMFEEHPYFGVGFNQYKATAKRFVQAGQWEASINSIDKHPHAHNQLLDTLATRGVLGFLALSFLFGYPVLIFYRRISAGPMDTSRLGFAGLLLVVAYFSCGLTDVSLHFEEQIAVYSFAIATLFGRIRQKELLMEKSDQRLGLSIIAQRAI